MTLNDFQLLGSNAFSDAAMFADEILLDVASGEPPDTRVVLVGYMLVSCIRLNSFWALQMLQAGPSTL